MLCFAVIVFMIVSEVSSLLCWLLVAVVVIAVAVCCCGCGRRCAVAVVVIVFVVNVCCNCCCAIVIVVLVSTALTMSPSWRSLLADDDGRSNKHAKMRNANKLIIKHGCTFGHCSC